MSLTLYEHPLSPYAQKCKIALLEKGVPFQLKMPAAIGTGQVDAAFLHASPRGERANVRLSVAQAAQQAADSIKGMAMVGEAVKQRLVKREDRDHRLEWMIRSGGLDVVLEGIKADTIRFSNEFR